MTTMLGSNESLDQGVQANPVEQQRQQEQVESVVQSTQKDLASTEKDVLTTHIQAETTQLQESIDENTQLSIVVDDLLGKYKDLNKGIRSREGNFETKRELRHWLNENIKNLNAIKKDLSKHSYSNLSYYKQRVGELAYYYDHYEQIRQQIVLGGRTGDIHAIIDSKRDAKRARFFEQKDAKYQKDMNDILHEAPVTSLWGNDMERYEEYLEAVLNGQVEPSTHPFFTAHRQSFNMIQNTNPTLYGALVPNGKGRITYSTYCQRNPVQYEQYLHNNNIVCHPESFNKKVGRGIVDTLEQLGVNFRDQRQKNAREKAGSVVALGGAIVLGWNFFKNLFSKKAENKDKRKNTAVYGAGLLALLKADKVVDRLKDAMNRHPAEKTRMMAESFSTYGFDNIEATSLVDSYIGAPVTTMTALHFIPIYELTSQNILTPRNPNGFDFNYKNYENYVNNFSWDGNHKKYALEAGKQLDKNPDMASQGLSAFRINNKTDLDNAIGGDNTRTLAQVDGVKEGREKSVEMVSCGINKDLYNLGLRAKSENFDEIMKRYNELGSNPDKNSVRILIVKLMEEDKLILRDQDKRYTLKEMVNNANIDLVNMTMKGFTNTGGTEIQFDSYGDLFDVVHLTDWIKKNFKGRPAVSDTPFHIAEFGRIEFDDVERYKAWKNETDILKARTIKSTSSLLNKNKEYYINYLNKWRIEEGKYA